jgi:hypothetical protein
VRVQARPFLAKKSFLDFFWKKCPFLARFFFSEWKICADEHAGAAHYKNVGAMCVWVRTKIRAH